jgi:hypothetical protein
MEYFKFTSGVCYACIHCYRKVWRGEKKFDFDWQSGIFYLDSEGKWLSVENNRGVKTYFSHPHLNVVLENITIKNIHPPETPPKESEPKVSSQSDPSGASRSEVLACQLKSRSDSDNLLEI